MKFAIVDIETTGGNSIRNKITEIAIYIHDGEKIIDQFVSLVNPECPIAPFISNLTGITNEMVEDAPKFYEIAKDIVTLTDGAVFVAHNAQFDYGFIREEYKSLGYNYSRDYLCTVKLSRKVFTGICLIQFRKPLSEFRNIHRKQTSGKWGCFGHSEVV